MISTETTLQALEEAALAGAEAIARLSGAPTDRRTDKGHGDFTTTADEASEAAICRVLQSRLPDIPLITEENPRTHGNLSGRCLIVDPLDGTHIFATGCPDWGISACYVEGGTVQAAVVAQPAHDRVFTATRGGGSRLNGAPFRVQARPAPNAFVLALPLSHALVWGRFQRAVEVLQSAGLLGTTRALGCAVANTVEVLFGRAHAYINLTGGKVWDLAAAALVCEEAGGLALGLDGQRLVWDALTIPTLFAQSCTVSDRVLRALDNC